MVLAAYQRRLENQSDRLGLEHMVNSGYDPREAQRVWKEMTKKIGDAPTDFFGAITTTNELECQRIVGEGAIRTL
jgi:predicted Zn-dependent protease